MHPYTLRLPTPGSKQIQSLYSGANLIPKLSCQISRSGRRRFPVQGGALSTKLLGTTTASLVPRGGGKGADLSVEMDGNEMDENDESDPWRPIGGGAVNEKQRHTSAIRNGQGLDASDSVGFQPIKHRSHLHHALEGLDRYPNYLQRWNVRDMDLLEASLEQQLTLVRQQRTLVMDVRTATGDLVRDLLMDNEAMWKDLWINSRPTDWTHIRRILDDKAAIAIVPPPSSHKPDWPSVQSVLDGTTDISLEVSKLTPLMDEECFDVYSFPLLSAPFVEQLREFIQALTALAQSKNDPRLGQLGRRPFDLDSIGLSWLNDLLLHLVMRPIARHLFQSTEYFGELDWRHGFIAGYSARPQVGTPRERLVAHTDDSEITLNVGLGNVFDGGHVEFRGLRRSTDQEQVFGAIPPRPGVALLHVGRHLHGVTQVTKGDRFALVVWARSWQGVRAQACPCCWLNRRMDQSCVCGSKWN